MSVKKTMEEISVLIKSRTPLMYILSYEEKRVVDMIKEMCSEQKREVIEWTITDGFMQERTVVKPLNDPVAALEDIIQQIRKEVSMGEIESKTLYILKDFHPYLDNNVAVVRRLKDIAKEARNVYRNIIILSPVLFIPPELEKEIAVIDFPLPDEDEIKLVFDKFEKVATDKYKLQVDLTDEDRKSFIKSAKGLTHQQAQSAFARAITQPDKIFDKQDIKIIQEEKIQSIKKVSILDYMVSDTTFEQVGGLENLKEWFSQRKEAFGERAEKYKLPKSKGVLLLGIPGCGKSLVAKSLGSMWNVPVLKLDVGRMFQGVVGASEGNMRNALKLTEAMSPCILFIDEIEKGFSGTASSNYSDAGTTSRVFQTFLNWLQDHKSHVFVIATANDISQLQHHHPEFFRAGRWDEKFFVDLPNTEERAQIWNIHISLRGRESKNYNVPKLVQLSDSYTGSEIEQAIVNAMYKGFSAHREFSEEDIESGLEDVIPMSDSMGERIMELRARASTVAKSATKTNVDKMNQIKVKDGVIHHGKYKLIRPELN